MTITFKPFHESHFPLLLKWLEAPHVKKWWDQDVKYTMELVKEKYSSYVKGCKFVDGQQKPIQGFIIHNNQNPIGYIQVYNAYDFPRSKPLSGLPENLGAFDILIGEESALQQGLGSKAILEFLKLHGNQYTHIFADPDSNNIAAVKAYEKAGFRRVSEQEDTGEVWMLWKDEANWDLYYIFEDVVHKCQDVAIKNLLDQFDIYDFLAIPIVYDLVNYKKIRLLKLLHNKKIPLHYEEWCGGNALHIACGAAGNLESVKFFIENNILTDIHKKSSKYGDTPLNLALSYEHEDILEYFKKKFHIHSISFDDLDVALDRLKSNYRKIAMRKAFFKYENDLLSIDNVFQELKSREPIFHHPEKFGKTKKDISKQMCDEFWEVGASGNVYTKQDVIKTLLECYNDPDHQDIWEAKNFELTKIATDNYLLTYVLIQDKTRVTRRSTLWRKNNGDWKILYHQGTLIEVGKNYE